MFFRVRLSCFLLFPFFMQFCLSLPFHYMFGSSQQFLQTY